MLHGSNVTKEGIQSCYQKFEDFKLIENLDLSFCNINDDIMKIIIEKMLIHYQKLKKLNVSYNNISNIGLIEIAKGLKLNSSLVSLDLSGNKIKYNNNNNMSSTCCLMKGKFMLYFDRLQNSIKNILIWSSLLSKNKEKYDGITELVYAIENHPNLLSLNLSATNITYNDIKTIAVSLKHNYILQYLDLSENNISDAGVIEIANALRVNNTLKSLNLSCNLISDEGVSELVNSLKINYNLTSLFLSENNIGDDGDEYLTILTQELEESNRIINITWW
jgi:Ran GTPase-activating protein (RanGAP) involved in mRNA processing and transport